MFLSWPSSSFSRKSSQPKFDDSLLSQSCFTNVAALAKARAGVDNLMHVQLFSLSHR